jgi:hypothetical protein
MSDPVAALARVGVRPVPAIDAGFADRLEARLREVHAAPGGERRPPHRAAWAALAGAAAVALALVVAIVTAPEDDGLTLTTATAATVVLPDGSIVRAVPGLELPDGALVRTGPNGSAIAGGVRVPARSTARVIDDRLVLIAADSGGRAPGTAPTVPETTSTSSVPPDTAAPATATPERPPTTAPPPPTTRLETTTTAPPPPLGLRVVPGDGGVTLHWTRYERPDFGAYVVYRIQGDGSTVVDEIVDPATTVAVDRLPEGRVGWQVVVLDRSGRVVTSSPVANVR